MLYAGITIHTYRFCFCSDGTSRQFAYIGFRNEQEAQDAITYFNKSFIDTLRISVLVINFHLITPQFHLCSTSLI